jgi:hypothetical protein
MPKQPKSPKKSENSKKLEDDEEFERPDWDEETYYNKAEEDDDDEEFDRPDWDEETWRVKLARVFGRKQKILLSTFSLVLLIALALPSSRAGVLNQVGARGRVSFVVLDQETSEPLRNVKVSIDNHASMTNEVGRVTFEKVKLGSQDIVIEKSAYESYSQTLNINWGENILSDVSIKPIGQRYFFSVVDWLSEKAIKGAEISYLDSVAQTGDDGKASINIIPPSDSIVFEVSASEYSTSKISVQKDNSEVTTVKLVATGKHHFVSSEDDKSGVYSINADGSEPSLIANEKPSIFTVSPSNTIGILVSKEGDASELKKLDLTSGEVTVLDTSSRIDLIGWIDDSIVYLRVNKDSNQDSPTRHSIVSYNTKTGISSVVASSNLFNDILVVDDYIYYAPSKLKNDTEKALYRVRVDGSNKTTVTNDETWAILRSSPDTITYNSNNAWYQSPIKMVTQTPVEAPDSTVSKLYTVSPFNKQISAWVDISKKKPDLHIINGSADSILLSMTGLRDPLHWLSDQHLIFRVNDESGSSDYIVNINGGQPIKLTDVTDTRGIEGWLFFFE